MPFQSDYMTSELEQRRKRAAWVVREILPHERQLRAWLTSMRISADEAEELVQEAYCRLSMLASVDHIDHPRAYFYSIARYLLSRRIKRQQVVPIMAIAELESLPADNSASPEQEVFGRMDYAKLLELIALLPDRCRSVVHLRKIEGWSQRRIAEHLGITVKAVEKQIWVGVRTLRLNWNKAHERSEARLTKLENEGRHSL